MELVRARLSDARRRFGTDTRGATAIEYALIAVFIAISIVVIVPLVGVSVNDLFATVSGVL